MSEESSELKKLKTMMILGSFFMDSLPEKERKLVEQESERRFQRMRQGILDDII